MPGDNCSVYGCGLNRRTHGVGIFQVPGKPTEKEKEKAKTSAVASAKLAEKKQYRSEFLNAITKTRIVDANFKAMIENDRVFACERHFLETDIVVHQGKKMTKRILAFGTIPRYNMKGNKENDERIDAVQNSRPYRTIIQMEPAIEASSPHFWYVDYHDFLKRVDGLKFLDRWTFESTEKGAIFTLRAVEYVLPVFRVAVDTDLEFTVQYFDYFLPDDHPIYKEYKRTMRHITLSSLILSIEQHNICEGTNNPAFTSRMVIHSIPRTSVPFAEPIENEEMPAEPYSSKTYSRSIDCTVLIHEESVCQPCKKLDITVKSRARAEEKRKMLPCKNSAPISFTNPARIRLTLQATRLKCSQLEAQLEEMRNELMKSRVTVDDNLSKDFINIMGSHKVTPFMNLFWQEQKKLFSRSSKGARFHPAIIRYCLSLHLKSPSAYEELRKTGILRLPSSRTLCDYKNRIKSKPGFDRAVLDDLIKTSKNYTEVQRNIALLFDEMKVRSNLVFDKHSGELIGYLDLGDPDINFASLESEEELASYVLVFFLRGLAVNLKYSLAHFSTNGASGHQIFDLFWEAVCLLETVCKLYVMSATSDGASSNRTFFKMCASLDNETNDHGVPYRTKNLYAPERYIYFFSDVPHLIKTARNCLENSAPGQGKRYMWNNGEYILWQHISNIFYIDLENGGQTFPKLTVDHIKLNPYSRMTVSYAAQVLSETMAVNLESWNEEADFNERQGTAKFCRMFDKFFDCLNTRNYAEGNRKSKPECRPYESADDPRLYWLKNTFLTYLTDWKDSVDTRAGKFTKDARSRMFLSKPTYEGLLITVNSVLEIIPILFSRGLDFVLTEKLCQDPLESHFGDHRKLGGRASNPDMQTFSRQTQALRVQKEVTCNTGNTRGRLDSKCTWDYYSDEPIEKRKRSANVETF